MFENLKIMKKYGLRKLFLPHNIKNFLINFVVVYLIDNFKI